MQCKSICLNSIKNHYHIKNLNYVHIDYIFISYQYHAIELHILYCHLSSLYDVNRVTNSIREFSLKYQIV